MILIIISNGQSLDSNSTIPSFSDSTESIPTEKKKINFNNLVDTISISYLKYKTILDEEGIFFNVVTIRNHYTNPISGKLEFILPTGWELFKGIPSSVSIPAGDSISIPIRLSISKNALGGGAYPIQSKLTVDNKNYSTSFFIYKSEKSEIEFHVNESSITLSSVTKSGSFNVIISNRGNIQEFVKLDFNIGKNIRLIGFESDSDFAYISLPPGRDTTFPINVWYRVPAPSESGRYGSLSESTVKISANSKNKTQVSSILCRYIPFKYEKDLSKMSSPLTIGLNLNNLLANSKLSHQLFIGGKIDFSRVHNVSYNLLTYNATFNPDAYNSFKDYINYNYFFAATYRYKNLTVNLGDRTNVFRIPLSGRGLSVSYKFLENSRISIAGARNVFNQNTGFSLMYSTKVLKLPSFTIYGGYLDNQLIKSIMQRIGLSSSLPLRFTQIGYSLDYTVNNFAPNSIFGNQKVTALGYSFTNSLRKEKIGYNASYSFQPYFNVTGSQVTNYNLNSYYKLKKNHQLRSRFQRQEFEFRYFNNPGFTGLNLIQLASIEYFAPVSTRTYLNIGPRYQRNLRSTFIDGQQIERNFIGDSYRISTMATFKLSNIKSITGNFIPGLSYLKATNYYRLNDSTSTVNSNGLFNYNLGVSYNNSSLFRLNINYFYGPYFVYDQLLSNTQQGVQKSLRISPIFQKTYDYGSYKIRFMSTNSFLLNISDNSERYSFAASGKISTKSGWTLIALANMFVSSREDEDRNRTTYKSYSLNLGVRKTFQFQQKNRKFFDFKTVCFKDLNGNGLREDNEPLLSDILVHIKKDITNVDPNTSISYFEEKELLSNINGVIEYKRIQNGQYIIELNPIVNLGEIVPVNGYSQNVTINSDVTYYVPFVETYKVRGNIKLVRDQYSNLGKIDISNVRVTATSENGEQFASLTDENGFFIISIPASGLYTVNINNVFGENFVIDNSILHVDFNGFKIFEVDFIFKEKQRNINMNGGYDFKMLSNNGRFTGLTEEEKEVLKDKVDAKKLEEKLEKVTEGTESNKKLLEKLKALEDKFAELKNQKPEHRVDTLYINQMGEVVDGNLNRIPNTQQTQNNQTQDQIQQNTKEQQSQNVPQQPVNDKVAIEQPDEEFDELESLINDAIDRTNPKVSIRVQIGLYKNNIPTNSFNQLIKLGQVQSGTTEDGGLRFLSRPFYTIEDAQNHMDSLKNNGYSNPQIVGDDNGKPIPVNEALQKIKGE